MKLEISFASLDRAMGALGAEEKVWTSPDANLTEFERIGRALSTVGIDVALEDVEVRDDLFVYKGHHVVLYIPDHLRRPDVLDDPSAGNKVHMGDCQALKRMKRQGRLDRYVATARKDDLYEVSVLDRHDAEMKRDVRLAPCRYCLRDLDYKHWATANREEIVDQFQLEEFFDAYASQFSTKPTHTDKTVGMLDYTSDFRDVSRRKRESVFWTCQECQVNLATEPSLLDVHHINGVKSDNVSSNLKALCKLCHANQPNHAHMRAIITDGQRRTINRLRSW